MSYNNIPLSNFLPSLSIPLISKISSKTILDFDEAMDDAELGQNTRGENKRLLLPTAVTPSCDVC